MHVIRYLGATTPPNTVTTTSSRIPMTAAQVAASQDVHWARDPGDVQVRQPAPTPTAPTPTRTTPAPTGQPEVTNACNQLWSQLIGQATPYVRGCINTTTHKRVFDGICAKIASGQTTLQSAAAQWAGYVAQQCPAQPPPQQQRTPTPPPPPTSTIVPPTTVIDQPSGGPGGGPGGDSSSTPSEDSGYLRQVGSIVGIGLVLAVGLTYARKKGMLKLTKRRTRR